MTLQYCSDLHLEFPENKEYLKKHRLVQKAKILLLAGDIMPFTFLDQRKDFLKYLSDHFEQTYWVPGNHEYYGNDMTSRAGPFRESIRSNVTLLNNTVIELENVNLVFTTLWSQIKPDKAWDMERGFPDFRAIKLCNQRLMAVHYNYFHQESLRFLSEVIKHPGTNPTVVVTHHVPTFYKYPEIYKGDFLNDAFASEQFENIHRSGFSHWIYGHHHQHVPDFKIGKTTLLTNPLGYVKFYESKLFNPGKTIEVEELAVAP